ncbi:MAG: hypothetical protein ACTSRK_20400 [Promethearchaeota archaeon]
MAIKLLKCEYCGEIFSGEIDEYFICQTCGNKNIINDLTANSVKVKKKLEDILNQSIEEIKEQMTTTGDVTAREILFAKHYKPKIETHYEKLDEEYEDFFRRPLFTIDLLNRVNSVFDVSKVFIHEMAEGGNSNLDFIKDLNLFIFGTLGDETIDILASGKKSKEFISLMKNNLEFLSKIYLIRHLLLNLNLQSIKNAKQLILKTIEICKFLKEKYESLSKGIEFLRYESWEQRLNLNLQLANVIELALNGNYNEGQEIIKNALSQADQQITYFKNLQDDKEKEYPMFLLMIIAEGFNVDKWILLFLEKMFAFAVSNSITVGFTPLMDQITQFIDICDSPFDKVQIEDSVWNSDWIKEIEDPFHRLMNLFEILDFNLKVKHKAKSIKIIKPNFSLQKPWLENKIISSKELDSNYFKLKNEFDVKNSKLVYIPIAVLNLFAVLKKGFIKKSGDEFESNAYINPLFRLDERINNYGYPRAFSYIDFEDKLKENDIIKQNLTNVENMIETLELTQIPEDSLVIPIISSTKEIEQFIQKTYDLFELIKDIPGIPKQDFLQNYKDVGISKSLERLSGEFIEYIYVPAILMDIANGKTKKKEFVPKEEYQAKLLFPFNLSSKNPWNKFLTINFQPEIILQVLEEMPNFE